MRYAEGFDSNDDEDDDDFDAETEAEMAEIIAESNRKREEEIELAEKQLRQELLEKAISVAKSSWFWGFYPNAVKLQKIAETFDMFEKLTD